VERGPFGSKEDLPGKTTGEGGEHGETVESETEAETPGQPTGEGRGLIEEEATETEDGNGNFILYTKSTPRKKKQEISRVNRKKSPSEKSTPEQKKGMNGEEQDVISFVGNL